MTDLHERTSEVVPAVALGIDPEKYYGLDKIMVSPDKGMLVVPGEQPITLGPGPFRKSTN